jgi:hypothetical protein
MEFLSEFYGVSYRIGSESRIQHHMLATVRKAVLEVLLAHTLVRKFSLAHQHTLPGLQPLE